jgi:WhiB family redox-sensing transcriptional regulator
MIQLGYADPDRDPRWDDAALCAQVDGEIFFPEVGGSSRAAKRVCGRCEVQQECLDYALRNDLRHGVWGGMSERERGRITGRHPAAGLIENLAEVIETVKALAEQEKTHPQIAAALGEGWTGLRVRNLCRRNGIKSGRWHRQQREAREAVLAA